MTGPMVVQDDIGRQIAAVVRFHYRSHDISLTTKANWPQGCVFFANESDPLFDFPATVEGILAAKEWIDQKEGAGDMKVRLMSDGTAPGTTITNAETGEMIGLVRAFKIKFSVDDAGPKLSIAMERATSTRCRRR